MRFVAAVVIGGMAFGVLMPGMPAFQLLSGAPLLYTLVLALIALVIGLVVMRRGWLAAAAAYLAGIAMWVVHLSAPISTLGTVRYVADELDHAPLRKRTGGRSLVRRDRLHR